MARTRKRDGDTLTAAEFIELCQLIVTPSNSLHAYSCYTSTHAVLMTSFTRSRVPHRSAGILPPVTVDRLLAIQLLWHRHRSVYDLGMQSWSITTPYVHFLPVSAPISGG